MIGAFAVALYLIVTHNQPVLIQVDEHNFTIQYPLGLVATNYDWNVEFSTNLQTMPFQPVPNLSWDTNSLIVHKDYPIEYFRLVGTPITTQQ